MLRSVATGSEDLVEKMALAKPEDLLASLGRLIADGSVTMGQADELYTRALRRRIVLEARKAVLHAAEQVVLHDIRSIGRMSTMESEAESDEVRSQLEVAVDNLIAESQRATVAKWKLVALGGSEQQGRKAEDGNTG